MTDPTGPSDQDPTNDADDPDAPSVLGAAAPVLVERQRRKRREGSSSGPRSMPGIKTVGAALVGLILLALLPSFASGFARTPRDRVGISYGGGPFEGSHFQKIVQPGSNLFWNGFSDPLYLYPSDQQNYIISKDKTEGAKNTDSVLAPSKDRVQVEYQVATYFKLNTDALRDFHEELGLKYKAYTRSGWDALIKDTFRQQIEGALQEETRRLDVADLYGDADQLVALQDRLQETVSSRLVSAVGHEFFCSPTYVPGSTCDDPTIVVKSIDIPEQVAKAFESNRTSQVQIRTKENEVLQRQAEAEGIRELSDALALAGDNYVLLKAIESGKIDFWVLPNDAGVTLTTPDRSAQGTTTPGG